MMAIIARLLISLKLKKLTLDPCEYDTFPNVENNVLNMPKEKEKFLFRWIRVTRTFLYGTG
jgi:hypothetical protein